jgi:hypothetical protein
MLTEFSHKVIFPNGQDRLVKQRRRAVYPSNGDVHMRCGNCGMTDFTAHLKPGQLGAAKLTNLICSLCGKIFPFNDKGETGGTLTAETANARKRESINERPDN